MMPSAGHQDAASRREVLPASLPPRGLSRVQAAAYIGVSPSLFDTLIDERTMPHGKQIRGRVVWDRLALDEAFAAIPDRDNPEGTAAGDKIEFAV